MIDAGHVTYHYPGSAEPAIRDVRLQVAPGELVGIVGPNGSGKSTLGRLLKGLILPASGKVTVDEFDTRVDDREARRLVGLLFQNPNSQIVSAVVEHEVAFGPENLGLSTPEIRTRVQESLTSVGLEGREEAGSHTLSMADKQRVALAAVLAMRPRYLILDEPTTWIEPAARWPLLLEIIDQARASNLGVILITHRMDEAAICERIYGMASGEVAVTGSPGEILGNERARELLALEVPGIVGVAEVLRQAGLPIFPGLPVPRLAEAICRS